MKHNSMTETRLRIQDPRKFDGQEPHPPLTKAVVKMLRRAPFVDPLPVYALLAEHLNNGDEDDIQAALMACPTQQAYQYLFGLLAQSASQWSSVAADSTPEVLTIVGIPLTLHVVSHVSERGWNPAAAPGLDDQALMDLRTILKTTGIMTGLRDLVVLPHLVDPAALAQLPITELHQLAPWIVSNLAKATEHPALAPKPWEAQSEVAQQRVVVLVARSASRPRGMDDHNTRCTEALFGWAAKAFRPPASRRLIASSPERLASLLAGKGMHMFNCASMVQFRDMPLDRGAMPFMDLEVEEFPQKGANLKFKMAGRECLWIIHGRTEWEEVLTTLDQLLPDSGAEFVRAKLGLHLLEKALY